MCNLCAKKPLVSNTYRLQILYEQIVTHRRESLYGVPNLPNNNKNYKYNKNEKTIHFRMN